MERKALGRWIASLVPTVLVPAASAPAGRAESREREGRPAGILTVPIDDVVPNPLQPRRDFNARSMGELAASIESHGVIAPLVVCSKGGKFELISGERRLRASRIAGLEEVPVVVREVRPEEQLELALVENLQRSDLNPVEEAMGYQNLIERFQYTQESVAERVGKDRATVANLLRILRLPSKVRQALQGGQISLGHARALAGVTEIERQIYFCDQVISGGWSVRELETRIAARRVIGLKAKMKDLRPLPVQMVQILDELRRRLGTQVRLIPTGSKGKIVIEYYSDEDLNRIYEVLVH